MSDAGGEDGEVPGAQRAEIADSTVDDEACHTADRRVGGHHLADDRGGEVTAGVDDDDVAGSGHVDRLVDHEIVARPRLYRECWPRQDATAMHRPQPRAARGHPPHRIADVGERQRFELADEDAVHLARPPRDPEADGHDAFASQARP